jgi:hypothetical protein
MDGIDKFLPPGTVRFDTKGVVEIVKNTKVLGRLWTSILVKRGESSEYTVETHERGNVVNSESGKLKDVLVGFSTKDEMQISQAFSKVKPSQKELQALFPDFLIVPLD